MTTTSPPANRWWPRCASPWCDNRLPVTRALLGLAHCRPACTRDHDEADARRTRPPSNPYRPDNSARPAIEAAQLPTPDVDEQRATIVTLLRLPDGTICLGLRGATGRILGHVHLPASEAVHVGTELMTAGFATAPTPGDGN